MTEKPKTVTCGVIITDTRGYLICHPTMSKWWDIPKGQMDPGETYVQTAIRELVEETGIIATPEQLSFIGKFNYKPKKDLVLYYWQVEFIFDIERMTCSSYFNHNGMMLPEMDKYMIVTKDEMLRMLSPALSKLLADVLK